mgnify:CR=1 FL=1
MPSCNTATVSTECVTKELFLKSHWRKHCWHIQEYGRYSKPKLCLHPTPRLVHHAIRIIKQSQLLPEQGPDGDHLEPRGLVWPRTNATTNLAMDHNHTQHTDHHVFGVAASIPTNSKAELVMFHHQKLGSPSFNHHKGGKQQPTADIPRTDDRPPWKISSTFDSNSKRISATPKARHQLYKEGSPCNSVCMPPNCQHRSCGGNMYGNQQQSILFCSTCRHYERHNLQ